MPAQKTAQDSAHVLIVGCGAIGGLFAAALASVAKVTAYDANAEHVRAINAQGLRVIGKNPRTAQSFCVPKADIAAQGYDLSLNRYKEVVHEEVAHRPPSEILQNLAALEKEITVGMKELEGMLK